MSDDDAFSRTLAAARKGADWALGELYREHHAGVLRYLRAMEPGDGEDLASEVWLQAAAGLGRFRGDRRAFRAWLFTIAHRRLVDLRRRRARHATSPLPLDALAEHAGAGDVEQEAIEGLSTTAALARIATLPADQATVVLLRVLAGLDAAEVGRIMGKRPGTVRVLQHRALKRLAEGIRREVVTG